MKEVLFGLLVLCLTLVQAGRAQSLGQIEWQQSFGGTGSDSLRSLRETHEGGYILAGFSDSSTNGNKNSPNLGGSDYWMIRIDDKGDELWEQSYGGLSNDLAYAVAPTRDGGFIVGGESFSGSDGNKTSPNFGGSDYWVVRLDGAGNKLWEATFGGSSDDVLSSVQQTSDDGFILGGWSFSPADGNKASTNFGGDDVWLVRLDSAGNKLWEKTYGDTAIETNVTIEVTGDDGFILGTVKLFPNGASGAWVVRLDGGGNAVWERFIYFFSSEFGPRAVTVQPSLNDQFLVGSFYGSNPCGGAPCPLISLVVTRLDSAGNQLQALYYHFNYTINPPPNFASVRQSLDGGFVTGHTPPGGGSRYYVMRLKDSGENVWSQQFGGTGFGSQRLFCLETTGDGGFILGGQSDRPPSGNKTSPNYGSLDFWVVKLFPEQPRLELLASTNAAQRIHFLLRTSYFGTYAIDRSTSLTNWEFWQTNLFTGITPEFIDGDTNHALMLYQARRLP